MTDNSTPAPVRDLGAVFAHVGELIAGIRPAQWSARTPCPQWNVRELVNHMVRGNRLFSGILRGDQTVTAGALDPRLGDVLGDDPVASYRVAAADLVAAFSQPGVLERTFRVPVGVVAGIAAVHLRAVEDLVHGWDLAVATGQPARFRADLVEGALEFSRVKLADVPPERSPFAPPQPLADDAAPLDRLAALLGRVVDPR